MISREIFTDPAAKSHAPTNDQPEWLLIQSHL
jgi:hypothetical protein